MLETKVHNKLECGFNLVTVTFGNFYGMKGFHSEKLAVKHVQIIQDNGKDASKKFGGMGLGAFFVGGTFSGKRTVDIELDLYLVDGRVIEVWTKDPAFLKAAIPYMAVKDPREKYRQKRLHYDVRRDPVETEEVINDRKELEEIRKTKVMTPEQFQRLMRQQGPDPRKWKL